MIDLSIIIVSWNVRDLLAACLDSIAAAPVIVGSDRASAEGEAPRVEVIVVDSASSDGSAAMIRARYPWVQLLAQDDNVGFTRGNNLALEAAQGRYLMLLNPDTARARRRAQSDRKRPRPAARRGHRGAARPERGRHHAVHPAALSLRRYRPSSKARGCKVTRRAACSNTFTSAISRTTGRLRWIGCRAARWPPAAPSTNRSARSIRVTSCFPRNSTGAAAPKRQVGACFTWAAPRSRITAARAPSRSQANKHIYFQQSKLRYFGKFHGRGFALALRVFLLLSYSAQIGIEGGKALLGSRRTLRRERIQTYWQVIRALALHP